MGKRLWAALAVFLLLSGCARTAEEEETLHILATTYPMYLLTTDLTAQTQGVEVELLVNSQTSCLHDYTLTVENMKAIEKADVIVMSGAGIETFMEDALAASDANIIDCSEGMDLLPSPEEHGHEDHGHHHEEEWDPHYWMDPGHFLWARDTLYEALSEYVTLPGYVEYKLPDPADLLGDLSCPYLITFHDGFQYFARAHGLTLLKAVEEEEGSTASAREIREIVELMEEYDIPAIFVEKNGSRATAEAIRRETGCEIYELDMLMSGEGAGLPPYFDAMAANRAAIKEALK